MEALGGQGLAQGHKAVCGRPRFKSPWPHLQVSEGLGPALSLFILQSGIFSAVWMPSGAQVVWTPRPLWTGAGLLEML